MLKKKEEADATSVKHNVQIETLAQCLKFQFKYYARIHDYTLTSHD